MTTKADTIEDLRATIQTLTQERDAAYNEALDEAWQAISPMLQSTSEMYNAIGALKTKETT